MREFLQSLPPWVFIAIIAHAVILGTVAYLILLERKVASWVQESFRLAVGFAYQGGRLPFVRDSDLDGGRVKPEHIPRLSAQYISEGHDIARQRVFLAAERLSRELNQL